MALGVSGNRDNKEAVGQFGEGFIVSLMVCLREGSDIVVHNANDFWMPKLEDKGDFRLLSVAEVRNFYPENNDFSVVISDVSEDEMEEIKERCLYLQDVWEEHVETEDGEVFLEGGGKVYVGGIYVTTETSLKHSYNFKPSKFPMNRDRQTVSGWDLQQATANMWSKAEHDPKEVVDMMLEDSLDVSMYEHEVFSEPCQEVKDEVYNHWKENINKPLRSSYSEDLEMERQGFKDTEYLGSDSFTKVLTSDSRYQNDIEDMKDSEDFEGESPLEILESFSERLSDEETKKEFDKILDFFCKHGLNYD